MTSRIPTLDIQRYDTDREAFVAELGAAYREWGDACVDHFLGMFAFGLWDAPRRRLLLARDRVGVKPLYYSILAGTAREGSIVAREAAPALFFGSEPKALLPVPGVSRALDPAALDAYLDLYYVPPPLSMFEGIRQLPPGHLLVWHDGAIEVLTSPADYEAVKAALEAAGLVPELAEVTMRPENTIELTGEDAERMQKLLDVIEDLDDTQAVYHNAELN